jgi:hypothetical protein
MLICGHLLEVVLGFFGQCGRGHYGRCWLLPDRYFSYAEKNFSGGCGWFMGGRADTEHSRWFGRLPHSRPQQLKVNLPVASVIDRLAAMSFIVLPLPPRRAAVAGSRAYRKWRAAAPLRGR